MDKMVVSGGVQLRGEVQVSGAKNSALPILFSTLLADGKHVLHNVPQLKDIESATQLLVELGNSVERKGATLIVEIKSPKTLEARYDLVRKMRASILCLGPLVTRHGEAQVSMPGGCAIGTRPIDQHLDGLKALGAEISLEQGYVKAVARRLKGTTVVFDGVTVGGTENILMAAVLAEGKTVIENAAKEPEIVDLANYLNRMGARVKNAGTGVIEVEGVEWLRPADHKIIPDRIEAGTLLLAGAITGGEVTVKSCVPEHLEALIAKLREAGFRITQQKEAVTVEPTSSWKGVDIATAPFPGFATDLQAQYMALMTVAEGTTIITENIFENRFMHVPELVRLNADVVAKTRVAVVRGRPRELKGAQLMATDLRASACLVLAGLVATGETTINRIYHLDRGYEGLETKLGSLGARVRRAH